MPFHRKGHLLLDLGRDREALAAFDAAIGLNPDDEEYWCDAAVACRRLGREAKAQRLLDGALRMNPTSERARKLRAETGAATA